jgi:putative addiction module component (TIGR02574 family)
MDTTAILEAFRALPPDKRLEVLCQLWDQLLDDGWMPPLDDERKAELDRRWANFRANPASGLTWEQVVAHVRRPR